MEFETSSSTIENKLYIQNPDCSQLISCTGIFNKMTIIKDYYIQDDIHYDVCIYTIIDGIQCKHHFELRLYNVTEDKRSHTMIVDQSIIVDHIKSDDEIDDEYGLIKNKYIKVDKEFMETLILDTIINEPHYMGEYNNMNVMFINFGFTIPKSLFCSFPDMWGEINITKNIMIFKIRHTDTYLDGEIYCYHKLYLKLDLLNTKEYQMNDIYLLKIDYDDCCHIGKTENLIEYDVIKIATLFSEYIINYKQRTKPLILPMIII